jgi:hypothetical protein
MTGKTHAIPTSSPDHVDDAQALQNEGEARGGAALSTGMPPPSLSFSSSSSISRSRAGVGNYKEKKKRKRRARRAYAPATSFLFLLLALVPQGGREEAKRIACIPLLFCLP